LLTLFDFFPSLVAVVFSGPVRVVFHFDHLDDFFQKRSVGAFSGPEGFFGIANRADGSLEKEAFILEQLALQTQRFRPVERAPVKQFLDLLQGDSEKL